MQVLLRIANGKSNVRKVRLHSNTVIGRSPDCQLKVASNQISRRHCQIVITETTVAIKDLGSANGTFVNGRRVPAEVEIPLTPGTRVMLGPLQFTVEYDLPGMEATSALISDDMGSTHNTAEDSVRAVPVNQSVARKAAKADVAPAGLPSDLPFPASDASPFADDSSSFGGEDSPFADEGLPFFDDAPAESGVKSPAADLAQTAYMMNPFAELDSIGAPEAFAPTPETAPIAPPQIAPALVAAPVTPVAATAPVAPALPPVVAAVQPEPDFQVAPQMAAEPEGEFNFGIFAESGSGVEVESAVEIPVLEPDLTPQASPPPAKPAKKGFLQMLGFGKKKPAQPEQPEETAESAPVEEASIVEPAAEPGINLPDVAALPEESISFAVPAQEEVAAADDDSPDDSFQNFLNNLK